MGAVAVAVIALAAGGSPRGMDAPPAEAQIGKTLGKVAGKAAKVLRPVAIGVTIAKLIFGTEAECYAWAADLAIEGYAEDDDSDSGRRAASCAVAVAQGCASASSSASAANGFIWDTAKARAAHDAEGCSKGGGAYAWSLARAATKYDISPSNVEAVVLLACVPEDLDEPDSPVLCLPPTEIQSSAGLSTISIRAGITSGSFLTHDPSVEDNLVPDPQFTTILFEGSAWLNPDGTLEATGGLSPSDFSLSTVEGVTTATLNPKTISVPLDLHGEVDIDGSVTVETEGQVGPVGGMTELLVDGADSPARAAEGSGSSGPPYAAIAGAAAATALALTAGGWYARRRLS